MLPSTQRIPRELFNELLIRSRYANSLHFSLRFRLDSKQVPKIGVSVSKKVSKSAVVRNSIRRRVYSVSKDFLPQLPNGLYLFVAKPKAESIRGEKLNQEIRNLLKEASLIV